jgi:hypothetical protein
LDSQAGTSGDQIRLPAVGASELRSKKKKKKKTVATVLLVAKDVP